MAAALSVQIRQFMSSSITCQLILWPRNFALLTQHMFAPGTPRAPTCLRCRLRQALRTASRSGNHYNRAILRQDLQRRHETTAAQETPAPPRHARNEDEGITWKHFSPRGKIRRIRGQRQREESESLTIKSLGKDSEVIVLRDVPERRWEWHRLQDDSRANETETDGKSKQSLTAQEIEALFKKQQAPEQHEIDGAIERHRPQEEVLSRQAFNQKLKALLDGYNAGQLSRYLQSQIPGSRSSVKPRRNKATADNARPGGVEKVARTPWFAGLTSITQPISYDSRAVSTASPSVSSSATSLARSSRKQAVAEKIFRDAWNVRIEEEAEAEGELELLLTPEQWGLLHTRGASTLFAVMRSRRFYQHSRFERDGVRGAIRVLGPKAEAEDIASLFETALGEAKSFIFNLANLQSPAAPPRRRTFEQIFTRDQLQLVMSATRTYIGYDKTTNWVRTLCTVARRVADQVPAPDVCL